MEKETLNAQEIEHLRDFGKLPEVVEEIVNEVPSEVVTEAQPTIEKAGSATVNEEVVSEQTPPTTEDLPGNINL